jgi:hypothetical protein
MNLNDRSSTDSTRELSVEFYCISIVLPVILARLYSAWFRMTEISPTVVLTPSFQLASCITGCIGLYGLCVQMNLIYKMWGAIQDGHARTTPGKAVGFCFIPLFGFFWMYQVYWGFSKDYNSYIQRHSLSVPRLPQSLFIVYVSLGLISLLSLIPKLIPNAFGGFLDSVNIFVQLWVVSKICDAVNAIAACREVSSPNVPQKKRVDNVALNLNIEQSKQRTPPR